MLLFSIVLCQITIFLNSVSYFKKIYFDFYDNATIINLTQKYDFHLNKRYGMLKTEKDFLSTVALRLYLRLRLTKINKILKNHAIILQKNTLYI